MPNHALVAVLLGTDHHRFDRLVSWVADLADGSPLDWFVQHGATPLPPGLTGTPLLSAPELERLLGRAAVVVTHGGPGLIMESRAQGHCPVVVARDPRLDEHVDDHQLRFTARIGGYGLCSVVDSREGLRKAVAAEVAGRRPVGLGPSGVAGPDLPHQVGDLVDALVAEQKRPRRPAWRR